MLVISFSQFNLSFPLAPRMVYDSFLPPSAYSKNVAGSWHRHHAGKSCSAEFSWFGTSLKQTRCIFGNYMLKSVDYLTEKKSVVNNTKSVMALSNFLNILSCCHKTGDFWFFNCCSWWVVFCVLHIFCVRCWFDFCLQFVIVW